MISKLFFILLIGAGLTACSSFSPSLYYSESMPIEEGPDEPSFLDSLINPYKNGLEAEMDEEIGRTAQALEKGRPCSPLNNWAADAIMQNQIEAFGLNKNFMVLLNVGGLRSTINAGPITVGEMYGFMPFDNEIVWVQLPMSSLPEVGAYIKNSGGEPISNARMQDGKLILNILNDSDDTFWIMTSDYLMNGGDNMSFFQKKLDVHFTGKLMRDAFIEQVKKEFTLEIDQTCRIDVD